MEAFSGGLSDDGTEFGAPCGSVVPPIEGYGVRLIRLCTQSYPNQISIDWLLRVEKEV